MRHIVAIFPIAVWMHATLRIFNCTPGVELTVSESEVREAFHAALDAAAARNILTRGGFFVLAFTPSALLFSDCSHVRS